MTCSIASSCEMGPKFAHAGYLGPAFFATDLREGVAHVPQELTGFVREISMTCVQLTDQLTLVRDALFLH